MRNFQKYRGRLRDYLCMKGVKIEQGNMCRCFSHLHEDKNPSCYIGTSHFQCYGCGIKGDVYDAVQLLDNIPPDKKRQFDFLEKLLRDDAAKKKQMTIVLCRDKATREADFYKGGEYNATIGRGGVYLEDVFGERVFLTEKDFKEVAND